MKFGVKSSKGDLTPYLNKWKFSEVKGRWPWDDEEDLHVDDNSTVEINTLGELLEFKTRCGQPIIISDIHEYDEMDNADYKLEIYDGYRE